MRHRLIAGGVVLTAVALAACGSAPTAAPVTPERLGSIGQRPITAPPTLTTSAPAAPTATLATPAPTATPAPSASAVADWPGYHGGARGSGSAEGFPAPSSAKVAWNARLDGAVYGQPVVVDGTVIAATEGDSVYGIGPSTGAIRWRAQLGTPVPLATLPCGNIDPLGITGAPAYDPVTRTLFVVAEIAGPRHVLFALSPDTGAIRWSRGVDVAGQDPQTLQQREALVVANGRVYIGFGGLAGDCGQYRGRLLGVPVTGQGPTIAYTVPVAREGAIWSGGGAPAVDAAGNLYVSVGNGSSTTVYDGSDSVLELSPELALRSRFAPTVWASDNATDADLGSMSPALLEGGWVVIAGKNATGYVLRAGQLGGIGGEVSSTSLCRGFGGASWSGDTVDVPCADGIQAISVSNTGRIQVRWRTTTGAGGPPVAGGGAVWAVNIGTGVLVALAASSGRTLASVSLGAVPHFASPTLWNGLVLVGTLNGVVAVRAAG
jgi:outer membrane protein assembly factor BamB